MKKFLLVFIFLTSTLFAQTPLTPEEVKAIVLQNAHLLQKFTEGSVFRMISKEQEVNSKGEICEYESIADVTVLLVPEFEEGDPPKIYFLQEVFHKPLTENTCDKITNPGKVKLLHLMEPPTLSLKGYRDFDFVSGKNFLTDDGLILNEDENEKCLYDLKVPLMFNPIRCENDLGVTDSITKLKDAELEAVYQEIKNLPVLMNYPSAPNEFSTMELPLKFGEVLEHWKNQPK